MRLHAEIFFNVLLDITECAGVRANREGLEHGSAVALGDVEFTGCTFGEVNGDDTRDFVTEWLYGDYTWSIKKPQVVEVR